MWNWNPQELGIIAVRSGIVYAILLIGIRLTGKRQIGQLTPFDLVVLLLISNAVQNAMTGPDTSVTGGIVAATTLFVLNKIVSSTRSRFLRFERFVEGAPTVLIDHGAIREANLAREGMTRDDLMQCLREHEVSDPATVELAMLEVDGTVSVIRHHPEGQMVRTRRRLSRHAQRPNN